MAKNRGELIVISLSPMQIAIIIVCTILLLIFSFLFGLRVGSRQPAMIEQGTLNEMPEPLTETEPVAAEQEPALEKSELTFNEKLTQPDTKPPKMKEPQKIQPPASVPPSSVGKYEKYTLQVGSFKHEKDANRFATQLSQYGYFTYVEDADLKDKGTWYRVKLGGYPTLEEAKQMKATLLKKHGQKSFVVAK